VESETSELSALACLSANVGRNALLVQAATGNTSLKLDRVLWIKASGKWLAHAAKEEIFLPVSLSETRRLIEQGIEPSGQTALVDGKVLGSSVETAMHAVLPYRIVTHVHSINTITWSILAEGRDRLTDCLSGLPWVWVPYTASGLALAAAVKSALDQSPGALVLVLANHGLVVCGESTAAAEALLADVERRIAITPRPARQPRWDVLNRLAASGNWWVPQCAVTHFPALDETARQVLSGGVLYPCQAIFLTRKARILPEDPGTELLEAAVGEPFVLIENTGVLLGERSNPTESATFSGLAQVLARIPQGRAVRYLTDGEVDILLSADCYRYRELVEGFGRVPFMSEVDAGPVAIMASKLA
jgi:rhamnose utilization protein RhaD (predicted bifunctional aldolase and dehydrogenase)